ncbi:hypothetical protein ACLOJK_033801 [Asimina triloba]
MGVGVCRSKDERTEKSKVAVIDGWLDDIRRSAQSRIDQTISQCLNGVTVSSKPSNVGDGEEVGNKSETNVRGGNGERRTEDSNSDQLYLVFLPIDGNAVRY